MVRKFSFAASRSGGKQLFRWSIIALAGTIGGMIIGEMVAEPLTKQRIGASAPFSDLSANPDAAEVHSGGILPCPDCRDSYGVAAQMRGDRENRMSGEFRELGAVDVVSTVPAEPDDDYRYGGRFPDPPTREPVERSPGALLADTSVTGEPPSVTEASTPPKPY